MLKKYGNHDETRFYVNEGGSSFKSLSELDDEAVAAGFFDKLIRFASGKLLVSGFAIDVKVMPITFAEFFADTEQPAVFVGLGVGFGRDHDPRKPGDIKSAFFTIVAEVAPQTSESLAGAARFEAENGGYAVSLGWNLHLIVSESARGGVEAAAQKKEIGRFAKGFHNDMTAAAKIASSAEWDSDSPVVPLHSSGDAVTCAMADVLCEYIWDGAAQLFDWSDDESEED